MTSSRGPGRQGRRSPLWVALAGLGLFSCPTVEVPDRDAGDADQLGDADQPGDADRSDADEPANATLRCAAQWPLATTARAGQPTEMLYARVWLQGVTPTGGSDPALVVEVGYGPEAGDPGSDPSWSWSPAVHNPDCLGCTDEDEFMGTVTPEAAGSLLWAGRARYGGAAWTLCDRADGGRLGSDDGWSAADAPRLEVEAQSPVRVVTLNLRCLLDDWDARMPLIVEALATILPDLVGFQEACAEPGGRDNLEELVDALQGRTGLSYEVERAVTHWSWDQYDEGIAIVTPHHIEASGEEDLPAGAFPRKALMARVVAGQEPVTFVTTHLDHQDSTIRAAQTAALVDAVAGFAEAGSAILLTGDFNEGPGGLVHSTLSEAGYTDLWAALRPGEPGYSFPAEAPTTRIDAVWLAGASGLSPASIELILTEQVGGVTGSDHLGLSAAVSR